MNEIPTGHHIAPNRKDMIGQRFGRLTVLGYAGKSKNRLIVYLCRCVCGKETKVDGLSLRRGHSRSCGCLNSDDKRSRVGKLNACYKHGMVGHSTYRSWHGLMQRCTNPKNPKFPRYGGRAIIVCERWKTFVNFLADMGPAPAGHTIERINVNGNYEKSNCCWLPAPEQSRNKTNHRWLSLNGVTMPLFAWCKKLVLKSCTIEMRLKRGWSVERALTEPKMRQNKTL